MPFDRNEDLFFDLAHSVTAGDLAKAQETLLTMMHAGPLWQQESILRARRAVTPIQQSEAPKPMPMPLPPHQRDEHGLTEFKMFS